MFRTVVVPLDGSPFSAFALPVATELAHEAAAELRVIGIAKTDAERASMYDHVYAEARTGSGVRVADIQLVVDSDPADVLLRLADDDRNVLCLASHDRMLVNATLMHSVGTRVIERATRPLFAVGANASRRSLGPDVVVALDANRNPEPLLTIAATWALRLSCPLRVVTVYEPVLPDLRRQNHYTRVNGPAGNPDAFLIGMQQRVADIGLAGVDLVAIPDAVGTASGLRQHLSDCPGRMLVVGGQHPGGRPNLRPGVARRILTTATLPLLIVNPS